MEDTCLYKILYFEMVILIVKDKKYSIKDTTSKRISFMYYQKRSKVMIPMV